MILHDYRGAIPASLLHYTAEYFNWVCAVEARPELIVQHWRGGCPMCCQYGSNHFILLTAKDYYWDQMVFQFAHEYCHHLINGPLKGEVVGLLWFEECLCHTASLWMLQRLQNPQLWMQLGVPLYVRSVQQYFDSILDGTEIFLQSNQAARDIRYVIETLHNSPSYERSLYDVVACRILPVFLQYPQLWRLIGHIGDSSRWQSLEELYTHLASVRAPEAIPGIYELGECLCLV